MRAPSWVELAGRNAAAESVYVTGTLIVSEKTSDRIHFDFHHAPGGKWRVEHDGQPVYLAVGPTSGIRVGDHMQQLDGDFQLPILNAEFNPRDLLGPESLLRRMSAEITADEVARPMEMGGRTSWSIRLLTPQGEAIVMAFDDATGVLVKVEDAGGHVLLQVDDLTEPKVLPDSLFLWEGPIRKAPAPRDPRRRSDEQDEDERIAFMRAVVAAQARPEEVLAAIAAADSENAARAALIQLLDVDEFGADAIMTTPVGQFRGDHAAANRRTLDVLEDRYRR